MTEATVLQLGDPCPRCGGEFKAAKLPTAAQYHDAFTSFDAPGLPQGYDTMAPDQRAEHGNLYTCRDCGLQTRFKSTAARA